MRKLILVCLTLLLFQGVCLAKIEKQVDKFDGSYGYYVDATYYPKYDDGYTIASFTLFPDPENGDKKYLQISLHSKTAYSIDPTIKVQIDDTIYTWTSDSSSSRANYAVDFAFRLPKDVYTVLMQTKKNVALRFYYKDLSGEYKQDFAIAYKTIKEVQEMYTKYSTPPPKQSAQ